MKTVDKSATLIKASGLITDIPTCDLYDPEHMALAWDLHLWAMYGYHLGTDFVIDYSLFWANRAPWYKADAQKMWLDKIFDLCVKHKWINLI